LSGARGPLRIAVVGAGISGLVAARGLDGHHEVTLFEASERPGGHTNTIEVDDPAGPTAVDTGFIIFNRRNYPRFSRLLRALDVPSRPTAMTFSLRCDRDDVEWCGSGSLNAVFGQRRNLVRAGFWRMLADILRFGRDARDLLADRAEARSVARFAADAGYGHGFVNHYLLPMGASLWSCPERRFGEFPARFVAEFMDHHGLLDMFGRPQWRTIAGGSRRYVDALLTAFGGQLALATPVTSLRRERDAVELVTPAGSARFDEVVLACHADQALAMMSDADSTERELLSAFPYEDNEAVLHHDTGVLPRRRRCWAAWNHRAAADGDGDQVAVTYNMNILQGLTTRRTWCVTLNDRGQVAPERVERRIRYAHPLYTTGRVDAQARHGEMLRRRRTSFCGAYWGYGFHEDGVASASAVLAAYGLEGP